MLPMEWMVLLHIREFWTMLLKKECATVLPTAFLCLLVSMRRQSLPDHPQPQQSLPDHPQPQYSLPEHPQPQTSAGAQAQAPALDDAWPRKAIRGDEKISMYQPQLETWEGDEIHAYAALSVESNSSPKPKYGAVWFTARTEVDKVNRQVTLDSFQITKLRFPTTEGKEQEYRDFLQTKLPGKARVIALDRLESALAAVASEQNAAIGGVPVKNDPPRIIF